MGRFSRKTIYRKLWPKSIANVVKSRSWKIYLLFWKISFILVLRTRVIHREINSISTELMKIHKKDTPVVLITSSLKVSRFPLSNSSTRSVFSLSERLAQTKLSIETALQNFPSSEIFLIDNSNVNETSLQELKLSPNVRIVSISNNISKYLSLSPYKGLGEAYITLALLGICKDEEFDFCKLSGRYVLTPKAKDLFPIKEILFKNLNRLSMTVFYALGTQNTKQLWYLYLYENLWRLSRGTSIEEVFYSFTHENSLRDSPKLYVEGLLSIDGRKVSL